MIKEAIVLAGGLGTRLKSVVQDIPKPMAPINNKPFLEFLLIYLHRNKIERVILSTGYMHDVIYKYFGSEFKNIELVYAIEKEPLGTGGGIINALKFLYNSECFLLNGDTFFNVNLESLYLFHHHNKFQISLSLKKMYQFNRYGSVQFYKDRIISFEPKKYCKEGFINGGVYILNTDVFKQLNLPEKFSFENDFLNIYPKKINMGAFQSETYFIDIGIPEDYLKAEKELTLQVFNS